MTRKSGSRVNCTLFDQPLLLGTGNPMPCRIDEFREPQAVEGQARSGGAMDAIDDQVQSWVRKLAFTRELLVPGDVLGFD